MPTKDLLIVDDEALVCESLKEMLVLEGYTVDTAPDGNTALGRLKENRYHLILSDIQMPGLNGFELLKELKGRAPNTNIVFITGHGHIDGAVEAIKLGAYDYITKPIDDVRLKLTIKRAMEQRKLLASYQSLKRRLKPWALEDKLVFADRKMDQLLELVHTIADTLATVLVTGESGTGKSMLAKYIHDHSSRRMAPSSRSAAALCPRPCWRASFSDMCEGPLPGPLGTRKVNSKRPTAAPSFWTTSTAPPPTSR